MKHTCIYCKQVKDENDFNREHVVPRMMGRYTDGLVLSQYQVCEECNSYFSKEIENKVGLNSYEAFLRMKSGTKRMSNGRKVHGTRISFTGQDGLFNGVSFIPIADDSAPEGFRLEIEPCIGIKTSKDEYNYYKIEELPVATESLLNKLKGYTSPIIQFGYDESVTTQILQEKGYLQPSAKYEERKIEEEYQGTEFVTSIKFSVDSILRRVCAKTLFNYLCWSTSAEYVLEPQFDLIRKYIRYGEWDESLWCRNSIGFVSSATPPNETSHAVGTMLFINGDHAELLGCVTWFGEITYIIKLCNIEPTGQQKLGDKLTGVILPSVNTKFAYFDNETTNISYEDATFIYCPK